MYMSTFFLDRDSYRKEKGMSSKKKLKKAVKKIQQLENKRQRKVISESDCIVTLEMLEERTKKGGRKYRKQQKKHRDQHTC